MPYTFAVRAVVESPKLFPRAALIAIVTIPVIPQACSSTSEEQAPVLRAERDWSQADLSDKLEVSQTVNAIETKRYDPSLPLAFRIARLFGKRIEDVFERRAIKNPAVARGFSRSGESKITQTAERPSLRSKSVKSARRSERIHRTSRSLRQPPHRQLHRSPHQSRSTWCACRGSGRRLLR